MVNPDRNLYDPPYDDALLYDNEMEPERPRSRSLIVMLAFVVLAAFAGVVWVAYNQGVQYGQRGVNPPLLSAEAGPSRVEPSEPGVSQVASPAPEKSYERLWASTNGERASGQENMMPGSEQPRSDAISQGVPTTQEVATAQPSAATPAKPASDNGPSIGGPLQSAPPVDPRMDSTVDLTAEVGTGISNQPPKMTLNMETPQNYLKTRALNATMPPESTSSEAPSVSRPSVKQTAASGARPISSAIAPAAPAPSELQDTPADPSPPAEVSSSSAGKVGIQLGSFPSDALAAAQWSRVKGANQQLLGAYSPQIVPANIPGKGVWYRLRVGGFADKSAAKAVCDQLAASGQACIIAAK